VDRNIVTDEELDQARRDPAFRKQLLASNLDHLLMALARLRASEAANDPLPARQIKARSRKACNSR
jgi:hypothetical protein